MRIYTLRIFRSVKPDNEGALDRSESSILRDVVNP